MSLQCAPCLSDLALVREAVTSVGGTATCTAHAVLLRHPSDDPGRRRRRLSDLRTLAEQRVVDATGTEKERLELLVQEYAVAEAMDLGASDRVGPGRANEPRSRRGRERRPGDPREPREGREGRPPREPRDGRRGPRPEGGEAPVTEGAPTTDAPTSTPVDAGAATEQLAPAPPTSTPEPAASTSEPAASTSEPAAPTASAPVAVEERPSTVPAPASDDSAFGTP